MSWLSFTYLEEYLSSMIHPLWLFLLPILLYSLWFYFYFVGCTISFLFYAYKKMNNHQENNFYSKFWDKPRHVFSQFVELVGNIWHGYEIVGMEHLPKGPGIIIFHHSIILVGYTLFVTKVYRETGRLCHSVIDHALYGIPGLKMFYDVIYLRDFKKAECVEILKKGNLLGIAPGGAREANFSNDYSLMWGNRTGFAQIALEAKVPIIPIYTQNSCETYRTIGKTRLTKWLYEKTRRVLLPIYGGFPVKLRTYIGEPIPYDPNTTPTELVEKTKAAFENLRDRHQKQPGNIFRAILERFDKQYKDN
ncbi:monoacylglycerol/Diacylglycerol O-acyltransferase [Zootoca vivipara]|uniref:monoacylglycerol/Diacylglycerol O-acyltransferase n=1 Tax=Zootoca vivipara TaxID=8524 RepID=UPI001590B156|nr:monoacylglycerol/Diacylglycerol O-acyltransferase [Zootoca vivipara]